MFDPVRICEILNEEGVAFVIVGGFASVVHGAKSADTRQRRIDKSVALFLAGKRR